MEVRFKDDSLDRLEVDPGDGGYPAGVARTFRKRVEAIRAATDERTFYGMKSLHFEKLSGDRKGQHSMRLNDQYRLILELEGRGPDKVVVLVEIEDYH